MASPHRFESWLISRLHSHVHSGGEDSPETQRKREGAETQRRGQRRRGGGARSEASLGESGQSRHPFGGSFGGDLRVWSCFANAQESRQPLPSTVALSSQSEGPAAATDPRTHLKHTPLSDAINGVNPSQQLTVSIHLSNERERSTVRSFGLFWQPTRPHAARTVHRSAAQERGEGAWGAWGRRTPCSLRP